MWLVDEAVKNGYTNENTVLYLLLIEFVALHTAAMVRHNSTILVFCDSS